MSSIRKLGWVGSLGLAAMAASVTLAPSLARADGPASPTGKGIAGGILLGAEVVMIPIAIGGIEDALALAFRQDDVLFVPRGLFNQRVFEHPRGNLGRPL